NLATDQRNTSASSSDSQSAPENAFDGDPETTWTPKTGSGEEWLQYDFTTNTVITGYSMALASPTDPVAASWVFEASRDGVNWARLDSRTSKTASADKDAKRYAFHNRQFYRYYRLRLTAPREISFNCHELGMYGLDDKANWTLVLSTDTTKTSASSEEKGHECPNAFDNNYATKWAPKMGYEDEWLRYAFFAPRIVSGYELLFTGTNEKTSSSWIIEGSNEGTSWTLLDTRVKQRPAPGQALNRYAITNTRPYKFYRLKSQKPRDCWFICHEWRLYGTEDLTDWNANMAADETKTTASSTDTNNVPKNAFDKNLKTSWIPVMGCGKDWIQYELPEPAIITGYMLWFSGSEPAARTSWILQGNNGGSTWKTLDTRQDEVGDLEDGKKYSFSNDTEYQFYRLQLTRRECWFYLNQMQLFGPRVDK
ncbi:MAG: discoidin domain-containing protein, partial [Candidatus Sumerlaeota bacterium]|nr:discoidin domain-containing protein [Candidatus Sumerlaeota bacterium]